LCSFFILLAASRLTAWVKKKRLANGNHLLAEIAVVFRRAVGDFLRQLRRERNGFAGHSLHHGGVSTTNRLTAARKKINYFLVENFEVVFVLKNSSASVKRRAISSRTVRVK
jgi:hypothetical protein